MALRDAGEVGVRDVRRFAGLLVTDGDSEQHQSAPPNTASPAAPAANERAAMPARRKRRTPALASVPTASPPASPSASTGPSDEPKAARHPADRVLLGDERQVYLQPDVPEAALQRVKTVSFELADAHRHLSRHQTILGALVWSYVDHADQTKLDLLADLLDAYRVEGWHGLPEDRRLSGRVPVRLKRRAWRAACLRFSTPTATSPRRLWWPRWYGATSCQATVTRLGSRASSTSSAATSKKSPSAR